MKRTADIVQGGSILQSGRLHKIAITVATLFKVANRRHLFPSWNSSFKFAREHSGVNV